jgi:hypothetical protein
MAKYLDLAGLQTFWNKIVNYVSAAVAAVAASLAQVNTNLTDFIAEKNEPNGFAGLDGSGKIPASLLPSYVDDVEEYANAEALPEEGEQGKIYITLDNNVIYRWGGSTYVAIGGGGEAPDLTAITDAEIEAIE